MTSSSKMQQQQQQFVGGYNGCRCFSFHTILLVLLLSVVDIALVSGRETTIHHNYGDTMQNNNNYYNIDNNNDIHDTIQQLFDSTDSTVQRYKQTIAKPMMKLIPTKKEQQKNTNKKDYMYKIEQRIQQIQLLYNELIRIEESYRQDYIHRYNIRQVKALQHYIKVLLSSSNDVENTNNTTTTESANDNHDDQDPSQYMTVQEIEELLEPTTLLEESESTLFSWIESLIDDVMDQTDLEETVLSLQNQQQQQQQQHKAVTKKGGPATICTNTVDDITVDLIAEQVYKALIHYMHDMDSVFRIGSDGDVGSGSALSTTQTTTSQMIDYAHSIVHQYTSPTYDPSSTTTSTSTLLSSVWWNKYIPQDWEAFFLPSNWQEFFTVPNSIIPDHILHTLGLSNFLNRMTAATKATRTLAATSTTPPEAILQSSILPGQCWPIAMMTISSSSSSSSSTNHPAQLYPTVTIRLQQPIIVSGITIDHVDSSLLHDPPQQIQSAPKHVHVYGYTSCATTSNNNNNCNGLGFDVTSKTLLSDSILYRIDSNISNVQTFPIHRHQNHPQRKESQQVVTSMHNIEDNDTTTCSTERESCSSNVGQKSDQHATVAISLEIIDNWGNKDYTCLYRIRVHGDPILQ